MSEGQIVSVISLFAALVLFASSYRSHRVGANKTLVMGLAWIGIFIVVAAAFASMG